MHTRNMRAQDRWVGLYHGSSSILSVLGDIRHGIASSHDIDAESPSTLMTLDSSDTFLQMLQCHVVQYGMLQLGTNQP